MDPNKQQIVERLKQATNILVTVSANPSIDQLASCIGITLFLNKLGKHATAVFSGEAPNTIEFLQPEATLEKNTNSLRDFIIALDKAKADKLRYKVEENVVKIFITPYRTSLSQDDLNFSQGDFNVEAVLALGVNEREDLDRAIVAHGRILHDATVMSVNAGPSGGLGSINWSDPNASSLSEMLTSMLDDLKKSQLDNQIATALLTGIVAETNRFSNEKTSPQAMSQAAVLMAAGANQQLIATKLQEPQAASLSTSESGTADVPEMNQPTEDNSSDVVSSDGTLSINHYEDEPHDDRQADDGNAPLDYSIHDEDGNESDLPNIHIDDGGNFKPLDEDISEDNEPQAEGAQQESEEQEGERLPMADEPPEHGGQLNATGIDEPANSETDDAVDPLTSPAQLESLLQHDAGNNAMQYEPAPMPPSMPNPTVGEVAEPTSPPAPEEPSSLPDLTSVMPSSAPSDEEPVLPPLQQEQLQADATPALPEPENVVPAHQEMVLQPLASPNEPMQPAPELVSMDSQTQTLDSARSAVESALNSGENLEPVQGLGTSPLSNGSLHEEPTPIGDILAQAEQQPLGDDTVGGVIDPTKAPDVPPPLLPPLPPVQSDDTPPTNPLFNQS